MKTLHTLILALAAAGAAHAQLPPDSTLDTANDNAAMLELVTDPMGFGWWPADAASWENVYLSDFADYLVAESLMNTCCPAQRYEKANAGILRLEQINMPELGGSNAVRNQPLTFFSFDDGADGFFDDYSETDYFGVSWVGGVTEDSFMRWRVDAGAKPFQIIHWWNHGLNERQRLTVTLHKADGTVRATSTSSFVWPGNTGGNIGFTSFITVHPVEATDYVIVRNNGTNVGWRATGIYYLEEQGYSLYPLNPTEQGYHVDDIFGWVYVFSPEYGWSTFLGNLYVGTYPWLYQFPAGWIYHAAGDNVNGLFLYSPTMGWIFTLGNYGGFYYRYDTGAWSNFL